MAHASEGSTRPAAGAARVVQTDQLSLQTRWLGGAIQAGGGDFVILGLF